MNELFFKKLVVLALLPDHYSILCAILAFLILVSRLSLVPIKRTEQILSVLALSGFLLAWVANGVWLSLVGSVLTMVVGAALLVRAERTAEDTQVSVSFIRRNLLGVLLTSLGACGLVSLDYSMDYTNTSTWSNHLADPALQVSVGLMLLGLLTVLVPWTSQATVMKKSRLSAFDHLVFTVLLPTFSIFSVLQRLHPHFQELEIFGVMGSVTLGFGILLAIPVYLRSSWEEASDHVVSLIPLLSMGSYCFAGPWVSFLIFLSSSALALAMASLRMMGASSFGRVLAGMSAYGWLGGMGFVSAGMYILWGQALHEDPTGWALLAGFYFLFAIQVWRSFFSYFHVAPAAQVSGWKWILPTLWVLLPLGLFYTGTFSGGALAPGVDQIEGLNPSIWPWLADFEREVKKWDEEKFLVANGIHWSLLVVTFVVAALTRTRSKNRFENWPEKFSRLNGWAEAGFGLSWIVARGEFVFQRVGHFFQSTVSENVWEKAIPKGFEFGHHLLERFGKEVDRVAGAVTSDRISVLVRAPSKLVQLTQSGNLQWYFVFGLIGSLLILIHFIRF